MLKLPSTLDQLHQLVSLHSVSSTQPGLDQGNRAVIDTLASWLTDLGFSIEIQELNADGSKANLIATLGSGPGGLVLAGHTDTVPFDEELWQFDPLAITERDGKLYGLGSTDMKGFFPLIIAAASDFADTALKQPLIILATADEESSMAGAKALAAAGHPRARQAIIGEPTGLRPIRLHKGIIMEAVSILGNSGHSSDPSLGNNALDGLHQVLGELMQYRETLQQRFQHSMFDVQYPTLNFGCVHGGDNPNRICGSTELHFDVRATPGCSNELVRNEIRQLMDRVASSSGLQISVESLITGAEAFEQSAECELVQLAEKLTGHTGGAVAFATEAPYLQQLGMDTIILGPGSIDRAHQPDEYIELDQFTPCIDLLRQFIRHFCV
ncbi:acetylornithine deacetylase [Halieaceae bacterium IMCC14734]|uniref:Acetylornithine deacetylase n=1 Tax=Candidatus Litorirhabdus singularis TaxID=2518993 RepID=A0ABT3TCA3_9GAMM|nr:acetylornithine deacetylase [Candidatus Litorirhabdus singularis]MCX2979914.1 acetylornithine deacetylase [Candidatus Litorirhabdus singularis]